jgi:hypothetical protein
MCNTLTTEQYEQLKTAYKNWQTSDDEEMYDIFVRLADRLLK